jgi:hypothetical protein
LNRALVKNLQGGSMKDWTVIGRDLKTGVQWTVGKNLIKSEADYILRRLMLKQVGSKISKVFRSINMRPEKTGPAVG